MQAVDSFRGPPTEAGCWMVRESGSGAEGAVGFIGVGVWLTLEGSQRGWPVAGSELCCRFEQSVAGLVACWSLEQILSVILSDGTGFVPAAWTVGPRGL